MPYLNFSNGSKISTNIQFNKSFEFIITWARKRIGIENQGRFKKNNF